MWRGPPPTPPAFQHPITPGGRTAGGGVGFGSGLKSPAIRGPFLLRLVTVPANPLLSGAVADRPPCPPSCAEGLEILAGETPGRLGGGQSLP